MITPVIAAQNSMPAATVQHNTDASSVLANNQAASQVQEEQRQIRETVIDKDEAVFYEQRHDAKEEGRNKYTKLYSGKKKNGDTKEEKDKPDINRVNFDIKI